MWMKIDQLPMSRANAILCVALAIGIAAALLAGMWTQAVTLTLILALGVGGIAWARRPEATDVNRVNAIEYKDERDVRIARDGFAFVGIVALVMSLAAYMTGLFLAPEIRWLLLGNLLILFITWGISNTVAARRH